MVFYFETIYILKWFMYIHNKNYGITIVLYCNLKSDRNYVNSVLYIFFWWYIYARLICVNKKHEHLHVTLSVINVSYLKSYPFKKYCSIPSLWNPDKPCCSVLHHRTINVCVDSAIMLWRWSDCAIARLKWCYDNGAMARRSDKALRWYDMDNATVMVW